jgi:hypothetical protein
LLFFNLSALLSNFASAEFSLRVVIVIVVDTDPPSKMADKAALPASLEPPDSK